MTQDEEWELEWRGLAAERADARKRMKSAIVALEDRAKDPFGIKEAVRDHPFVTTAVSAGVGALLVNLFMSGKKKPAGEASGSKPQDGGGWADALKKTAMSVAAPLVTRFLKEKLQDWLEPKPAQPESEVCANGDAGQPRL